MATKPRKFYSTSRHSILLSFWRIFISCQHAIAPKLLWSCIRFMARIWCENLNLLLYVSDLILFIFSVELYMLPDKAFETRIVPHLGVKSKKRFQNCTFETISNSCLCTEISQFDILESITNRGFKCFSRHVVGCERFFKGTLFCSYFWPYTTLWNQ